MTIKVLHVTPHLGGGVGRVLSSVTKLRRELGSDIEEIFVCLEPPVKHQYVDILREVGVEVVTLATGDEALTKLVESVDIVQVEWGNQPLIAEWMCQEPGIHARMVIWSHTSGLHYPAIPAALIDLPHAFLFTSPVSLQATGVSVRDQSTGAGNLVGVVHSSGGFDDLPMVPRDSRIKPLNYGYLGSLNVSKLHPDILAYFSAVETEGFAVNFFGDAEVNPELGQQAVDLGVADRLHIRGFTERPDLELQKMDVFVYLLNPLHYGTTENALLEAMACGVVPIVLDNRVETTIVKHQETGLVVRSPQEFNRAIEFLNREPHERLRLSRAAQNDIRQRFTLETTEYEMAEFYRHVMTVDKRVIHSRPVFGETPTDWFLSCVGRFAACFQEDKGEGVARQEVEYPSFLYETTKSSVFHFQTCFPEDPGLKRLAALLESRRPDASVS